MTWEYGYRELPISTANLVSPVAGQIYFNDLYAIIPDTRPIFEWQWPITAAQTPDAWIVSFDIDPSNDMGGKLSWILGWSRKILTELSSLCQMLCLDFEMISIGLLGQ